MVFVELRAFTRRLTSRLSDEEYRLLQATLIDNPRFGPVMPRSGGLRKIRVRKGGSGKREGARVIYYYIVKKDRIYFLDIFDKSEKSDLSKAQVAELRQLVQILATVE